jgi:hypothetical protein
MFLEYTSENKKIRVYYFPFILFWKRLKTNFNENTLTTLSANQRSDQEGYVNTAPSPQHMSRR